MLKLPRRPCPQFNKVAEELNFKMLLIGSVHTPEINVTSSWKVLFFLTKYLQETLVGRKQPVEELPQVLIYPQGHSLVSLKLPETL